MSDRPASLCAAPLLEGSGKIFWRSREGGESPHLNVWRELCLDCRLPAGRKPRRLAEALCGERGLSSASARGVPGVKLFAAAHQGVHATTPAAATGYCAVVWQRCQQRLPRPGRRPMQEGEGAS